MHGGGGGVVVDVESDHCSASGKGGGGISLFARLTAELCIVWWRLAVGGAPFLFRFCCAVLMSHHAVEGSCYTVTDI